MVMDRLVIFIFIFFFARFVVMISFNNFSFVSLCVFYFQNQLFVMRIEQRKIIVQ